MAVDVPLTDEEQATPMTVTAAAAAAAAATADAVVALVAPTLWAQRPPPSPTPKAMLPSASAYASPPQPPLAPLTAPTPRPVRTLRSQRHAAALAAVALRAVAPKQRPRRAASVAAAQRTASATPKPRKKRAAPAVSAPQLSRISRECTWRCRDHEQYLPPASDGCPDVSDIRAVVDLSALRVERQRTEPTATTTAAAASASASGSASGSAAGGRPASAHAGPRLRPGTTAQRAAAAADAAAAAAVAKRLRAAAGGGRGRAARHVRVPVLRASHDPIAEWLTVRDVPGKGRGVFARRCIPPHTRIGCYTGVIILQQNMKFRLNDDDNGDGDDTDDDTAGSDEDGDSEVASVASPKAARRGAARRGMALAIPEHDLALASLASAKQPQRLAAVLEAEAYRFGGLHVAIPRAVDARTGAALRARTAHSAAVDGHFAHALQPAGLRVAGGTGNGTGSESGSGSCAVHWSAAINDSGAASERESGEVRCFGALKGRTHRTGTVTLVRPSVLGQAQVHARDGPQRHNTRRRGRRCASRLRRVRTAPPHNRCVCDRAIDCLLCLSDPLCFVLCVFAARFVVSGLTYDLLLIN